MLEYSILPSLRIRILVSLCLLVILGCQTAQEETVELDPNPASEGFNLEASDSLAIHWADLTMHAMGGRRNWDETRFISWNFFGRRDLLWDKATGNVRIESPFDSLTYLININTNQGKVRYKESEVNNADSVTMLLDRAKRIWINDSYWLVMPFKLKDSGVTLKYLKEGMTTKEEKAHVLELTFNEVGVTPNNKYEVFITQSDSLVKEWAYFSNAEQDSASAIWPWDNYKEYGSLKLSADRSDNKGPKDVKVFDSVPEEAFSNFDWKME